MSDESLDDMKTTACREIIEALDNDPRILRGSSTEEDHRTSIPAVLDGIICDMYGLGEISLDEFELYSSTLDGIEKLAPTRVGFLRELFGQLKSKEQEE